jgi:hypothetical protein
MIHRHRRAISERAAESQRMKTMIAAIISMAATAIVWANTVEAIFLVASFMALPSIHGSRA